MCCPHSGCSEGGEERWVHSYLLWASTSSSIKRGHPSPRHRAMGGTNETMGGRSSHADWTANRGLTHEGLKNARARRRAGLATRASAGAACPGSIPTRGRLDSGFCPRAGGWMRRSSCRGSRTAAPASECLHMSAVPTQCRTGPWLLPAVPRHHTHAAKWGLHGSNRTSSVTLGPFKTLKTAWDK